MTIALLIAGGLILLFAGGEALVRGAVGLARSLGVSPLMIGLTVVGFGTSAPELVTSLQAALAGSPGIAIGNIIGSNLANVLLILGVAALIAPIPCARRTALRDGGLMVGSALVFLALAVSGILSRLDGILLLAALAVYLVVLWRQERTAPASAAYAGVPEEEPASGLALLRDAVLTIAGIAGVVLGGYLLVTGAVALAESIGVSETVIGLTIVAVGTSMPELATAIVAAYRGQSDIAYGNIVGSNVFNVLCIAGVTAVVVPIPVPGEILAFDLPVMIGVCVLMVVFALTGRRISRLEGGVLLAGYGLYLGALAVL